MQRKFHTKLLLTFLSILFHQLLWAQVSSVQSSIDAACPCNGPVSGGTWVGHGDYVSCVTAKVNQLSQTGVIAKNQKAAYISAAAQSECGKNSSVDEETKLPEHSSGVLTMSGAGEKQFNARNLTLTFNLAGAQFSSDISDFMMILNGVPFRPTYTLAANSISFNLVLSDGLNEFSFLGTDATGLAIENHYNLWAGSANLSLRLINTAGGLLNDGNVRVSLSDDPEVFSEGQAVNGIVTFQNIPFRTIISSATAPGNLYGSVATVGGGSNVNLVLHALNSASLVNNNDFSLGTQGWNIGSAPVQIIEHMEGTPASFKLMGPAPTTQSITNPDLQLLTSGQGPQYISRTYFSSPGTKNVTVRFRFITSEVPGGYFNSQYNDYYSVIIRKQNGTSSKDENSMNGLGLAAFDYASGATNWREVTIPVDGSGEMIQVDVVVANVGDGALDSKIVIDYIGEKKLAITNVAFFDPDKNSLLSHISLDNPFTYFEGKVPVYGSIAIKGAATDKLNALTMEIVKGNQVIATAPLEELPKATLFQPFGSDELVEINTKQLFFKLPQTSALNADGKVQIRIIAETEGGERVSYNYGSLPNLQLYQEFGTDKRFGKETRDLGEGGDGWALKSTLDFIGVMPEGWKVNDISNMNGNYFIGHTTHRNGNDIDLYYDGYMSRDATVASTLINFLNSTQGSQVAFMYVTFTDAFKNAIKDVNIGTRKATDIILDIGNHIDHFHIRVKTPVQSSKMGAPVIRPERVQPVDESVVLSKSYNVFPNPANNTVNIMALKKDQTIEEIRIFNSAGILVQHQKPGMAKNLTLNTNKLKSGAYVIEISGAGKTERSSIIITH